MDRLLESVIRTVILGGLFYAGYKSGEKNMINNVSHALKDHEINELRRQLGLPIQ